ncbi:hypothetical protein E2C01_032391 [Portunus trituberculatus]|uniref:Uncharacterized protein n=1 Tax=Portunus trituberculatus TaxID=210409 RepID=A0A5B7EZI3_PORTR|nr:hypothetical protein [Portunus trituberculatus]
MAPEGGCLVPLMPPDSLTLAKIDQAGAGGLSEYGWGRLGGCRQLASGIELPRPPKARRIARM